MQSCPDSHRIGGINRHACYDVRQARADVVESRPAIRASIHFARPETGASREVNNPGIRGREHDHVYIQPICGEVRDVLPICAAVRASVQVLITRIHHLGVARVNHDRCTFETFPFRCDLQLDGVSVDVGVLEQGVIRGRVNHLVVARVNRHPSEIAEIKVFPPPCVVTAEPVVLLADEYQGRILPASADLIDLSDPEPRTQIRPMHRTIRGTMESAVAAVINRAVDVLHRVLVNVNDGVGFAVWAGARIEPGRAAVR